MFVVQAATGILNLITGVSEICIGSVEILTADCGVAGIRHSGGISRPKVPEMALPPLILTGYLIIQKFEEKIKVSSTNQVLK
jgi:hypothetical protein